MHNNNNSSRRSSLLSWVSFGSTTDTSAPSTPTGPSSWSRSSSFSSLTTHDIDQQTSSAQQPQQQHEIPRTSSRGSFTKSTFSTMMDNLSNFSISRGADKSDDKDRDRGRRRSASQARPSKDDSHRSRTRSTSPFWLRHKSRRDSSPQVAALPQSDAESDSESLPPSKRPRNSAFTFSAADDSASEGDGDGSETDASEESWSDGDPFDDVTEFNTERNALTSPTEYPPDDQDPDHDPLGEGVNVVVPPEPLFPTTLHGGHASRRGVTRKKTIARPENLPLQTSRPVFQRNRCTIWLTNGHPLEALEACTRKARRYVVASDLSIESKYAVEWCIGTVMRDGDEMIVVTASEAENKLDPEDGTVDRVARLRNQQERQTLSYLLVRQVTSLLQRTRLNVTVVCQAWHAKNSRHLLLDLVDFTEPTMLIVGSRGLGKLKGILLGSTSHYLIQRSSVPVMVARRRLKRPPKRSAHLSSHRARVPLSKAAIDKAPSKLENDVAAMRDEILARDEGDAPEREEGELDPEAEGVAEGAKDGGAVSPVKLTA